MYDNLNAPLLNVLSPNLSRVIDIGCATGRLGFEYKKKSVGSKWTGVEIDESSCQIARTRLDKVYNLKAEEIFGRVSLDHDCYILADVVEHLLDPRGFMEELARAIKSHDGKNAVEIYFSVPNVQHWSVLYQLLRGKFERTQEGILDSTHLHFWTYQEFVSLLKSTGYSPVGVLPLIPPEGDKICEGWGDYRKTIRLLEISTEALGITFDRSKFLPTQYIFKCKVQGQIS